MAKNRPQTVPKAPPKTPAELQRQLVEFHTAALETAQRQLEAERDKPDPDEKKLQRAKTAAAIADARRVEYDANEHKAALNAVLSKINALRSEVMTAIGETDRVKGRAFDTHNRLVQNLRHEGAKEDEIRDVLERADKARGR